MLKLSVIIPTYNEETTIKILIDYVKSVKIHGINKEIIVVDDASIDNTEKIVKGIKGITYVKHKKNKGKGGALKTGIAQSTGDYVIFQDADLEYNPSDYFKMLEPMLLGKADFTNGVRIQPNNDQRSQSINYWFHRIGNRSITILTNLLYGIKAEEYEGCYKAFPRDLLLSVNIKTNNFDYDNELVCRLLKIGAVMVDVPIMYAPRDYQNGKKIKWHHGFRILCTIIKVRFLK